MSRYERRAVWVGKLFSLEARGATGWVLLTNDNLCGGGGGNVLTRREPGRGAPPTPFPFTFFLTGEPTFEKMELTTETLSLSGTRRTRHPIRTWDTNTPRGAPSGPGSSKRGGQSTFLIDYQRISRSRLGICALNATVLSLHQLFCLFFFAD